MRRLPNIIGASGLALVVAGCMAVPPPAPLPPPVPVPGPLPIACNAARASWALGERASPSVLERATLESGARSARVLSPGEVTTMEFSADRLSISVNAGNRITDVRCG